MRDPTEDLGRTVRGIDVSSNDLDSIDEWLRSLPPVVGDVALVDNDRDLLQQLHRLAPDLQHPNAQCMISSTREHSAMEHNNMLANIGGLPSMPYADPGNPPLEAVEDGGDYDEDDDDDEDSKNRPPESLLSNSEATSPSATAKDASVSQTRPHAAVEKRYRRTVNTKLQQLHASIPPSGKFSVVPEKFDLQEHEQAAKPVVLDKAIQYVSHLLETYRKYDDDVQELRRKVRAAVDEDELHQTSVQQRTTPPGSGESDQQAER